jgi:hypothetical protein
MLVNHVDGYDGNANEASTQYDMVGWYLTIET